MRILVVGGAGYVGSTSVETFVDAVESHAGAVDHGDHGGVIEAMQRLLPSDSLLFLMDLSIEPTLAALRQDR